MNCSKNRGFHRQTRESLNGIAPYGDAKSGFDHRDFLADNPVLFCTRYESQMELLKKSHSREMGKLKRSSMDGSDGLQTEVAQLQVEMENMSQKYMEEIENLKVCAIVNCQRIDL